jgi:hypothetical protein
MCTLLRRILLTLCNLAITGSLALTAHAGTFSNDFSSATISGFTLNGGTRPGGFPYPAIENGYLALTYAENSEQGTIVLDDLDAGATISGFTATFKLRIGGGSSTPADGLTFHFGSDIDSSANFGEEGPPVPITGRGIDVCFDTYDNVDGDPTTPGGEAPAIDVKVDGVVVASTQFNVFFMLSDVFTNVVIQLNPNGTLNVSYKGQTIYTNLYLPGYSYVTAGRFAIGARTGGANENNWVDDLVINTTVAGPAAPPTLSAQNQPQSQTVNERSPVTFSVLPDGTPAFTFQWYSNDVAIADATNNTYTIANAPFSANGAKYKVGITNSVSGIFSAEATLTVNQDTNPPTIVSVNGSSSFTAVRVVYSEPVAEATATNLANYSLSGGLIISSVAVVSPTTVELTTSLQAAGTSYTLTVSGVQDTATIPNAIAPGSQAVFTSFVLSQGFLKFEYWGNIGGTAIAPLLTDPRYLANTPDLQGFITPFDTRSIFPDDSHENYGARITGFITPVADGDYDFFLRSDDASELHLSTDADPANVVKICEETGCCEGFKEPNPGVNFETTQVPIHLLAGQRYPVLAFLKEGGGGDYLQVAWRRVGDPTPAGQLTPVAGTFLSVYANPSGTTINITQQPQSQTRPENSTATFTVAATGSPTPLSYQWQRAEPGSSTFTNIPGGNGTSYTTPVLNVAADNNAKYRAVVWVPGRSTNSAEATLTVILDTTPPTLASASAGEDLKSITATFSEAVNAATANVAANYSIPGLVVSNATLIKPNVARLGTSLQPQATTFTLTVSNVRDEAGNLINSAANSQPLTTPVVVPGGVLLKAYTGIGGTAVADLTNNAKYPDSPDALRLTAGFDAPSGFGDNFGGRMVGWFVPAETTNYDFFIRSDDASELYLSTDDSAANLSASPIAYEPGCCQAFLEPGATQTTASPILLEAGKRYFMVALYKEGGGGDFCQVAVRISGDPTPAASLQPIRGSLVSAAVPQSVLDGIKLPVSLLSPIGSGDATKPGFRAKINQADQLGATVLPSMILRAEQQLAGLYGTNVANLTGADAAGFVADADVINWNQELGVGGTGVEIGSFTSASTPPAADEAIPGIPGNTTNPGMNTDDIAADVRTYVEFPTAGVHFLGVNSDDGFNVTAAEGPGAHIGALEVSTPAAIAGSYAAVYADPDLGGISPKLTSLITGQLVYADPPDACTPLNNAAAMPGRIALVDRGVCTFSSKIQQCINAGAIAVVVVNSRDPGSADGIWPIVMGGTAISAPSVMITKPDGAILKAQLAAGITATIAPDPTTSYGSFNNARGATDSIFPVYVTTPGVYPLRCVWFEGNSGANVELFSLLPTGEKVLLNQAGVAGALKTYRARTVLLLEQPTLSGDQVTIRWSGGRLQHADDVTGPWIDVPGNPASPYVVNVTGTARKFYRVVAP